MYSLSVMPKILPHNGVDCQPNNPQFGKRQKSTNCVLVPVMGNNLKALREEKGWTHEQAGAAMNVSRSQFIKLERGERRLTADYIAAAARAFGVSEAEVIRPRTVPLVGYVGAGALAHIFSDGQGGFDEVPAPDNANESTVAVEIRGESLGPFFEGWLAYYDERREDPGPHLLGRVCIVGLKDGRILIKKLQRGTHDGFYHLFSQFDPPMYDVQIEWAAVVKDIKQR